LNDWLLFIGFRAVRQENLTIFREDAFHGHFKAYAVGSEYNLEDGTQDIHLTQDISARLLRQGDGDLALRVLC
jgi:hypothetical protein